MIEWAETISVTGINIYELKGLSISAILTIMRNNNDNQ